jgi:hypothetical protein
MMAYIKNRYIVGDLVVAKEDIIEPGFEKYVEGASDADAPWHHAEKGHIGLVVYVAPEDGIPCVRFANSGTATDCGFDQIEFKMRCHSMVHGKFAGMGAEHYPDDGLEHAPTYDKIEPAASSSRGANFGK